MGFVPNGVCQSTMVVFFETMGQQDLTQPDLTVGSGFFSDMNRDVFLKVSLTQGIYQGIPDAV